MRTHSTKKALLLHLVLHAAIAFAPDSAGQDSPFPPASAEELESSSAALDLLAAHVERLVETQAVVGAELHVIQDRKTTLRRSFGWAHRDEQRPLEPNAIFCVRSMTKPLVGTAIQMLLDQGVLALDDLVADYVPAYDRPETQAITIEHLLTHRSGLPFTTMQKALPNYRSVADVASEAAAFGLKFEPGSNFQYSDAGSDTLGAIVAEVTGEPIETFVQENILDPLGMTESITVIAPGDPRLARVPSAYSGGRGSWQRHWGPDMGPLFPIFLTSQSLYATTTDYARFLTLWMDRGVANGERLLSEGAIDRGLTARSLMQPGSGFDGLETYYGQQWVSYSEEVGAGPRVFGHSGSDGTYAWAWPEHDLMVLFFTQSRMSASGMDLESVIERLLIEGDVEQVRTQFDAVAQNMTNLERFAGIYWDERSATTYSVIHADGKRLMMERPGAFLVELVPTEKPGEFTTEGEDTAIIFDVSEAGPVTEFLFPNRGKHWRQIRHEPGPDLPEVADILAYMQDSLGADLLEDLGGVRMTGTLTNESRKMSGTIELLISADRLRFTIKVPQGERIVQISEDGSVWVQEAGQPAAQAAGGEAINALLLHPLYRGGGWEDLDFAVQVLARVDQGERSMVMLRAEHDEAPASTKLIDEESGELWVEAGVERVPGIGQVGYRTRFDDYRDVEGVMLPFKVSTKYAHWLLGTVVLSYDEFETGIEFEDLLGTEAATARR